MIDPKTGTPADTAVFPGEITGNRMATVSLIAHTFSCHITEPLKSHGITSLTPGSVPARSFQAPEKGMPWCEILYGRNSTGHVRLKRRGEGMEWRTVGIGIVVLGVVLAGILSIRMDERTLSVCRVPAYRDDDGFGSYVHRGDDPPPSGRC